MTGINENNKKFSKIKRLAAQGKIRLGKGPIDDGYWKLKLPRVKTGAIKARNVLQWLIDEERDEG
jgi:hypothetical protein